MLGMLQGGRRGDLRAVLEDVYQVLEQAAADANNGAVPVIQDALQLQQHAC